MGIISLVNICLFFWQTQGSSRQRKRSDPLPPLRKRQVYQYQSTYQVQMSSTVLQTKFDISNYCQICLENGCDLITNCNHRYHFNCMKEWSLKHRSCPRCRNNNLLVNIQICQKCKSVSDVLDIFDNNFLQKVEKTIKEHRCYSS